MNKKEASEYVVINTQKINKLEYVVIGNVDIHTALDGHLSLDGLSFLSARNITKKQEEKRTLGAIRNALLQDMHQEGASTNCFGAEYSVPDMEWLSNTIDSFLYKIKDKVLSKKSSYYILSAKCSSIFSNISITLKNHTTNNTEKALQIECVQCALQQMDDKYLIYDFDPEYDTAVRYKALLTYIVSSSGGIDIKNPVIIATRPIIIPENKFKSIKKYKTNDLKTAVRQLSHTFSEVKILPAKLDGIKFKTLKDASGTLQPSLVLNDIKIQLNNKDGATEVELAKYLFGTSKYDYGDIILFEQIHDSSDEEADWFSLSDKERKRYITKIETASRSLNITLAKHFGLGDTLTISMDKANSGIRVNQQVFAKPR